MAFQFHHRKLLNDSLSDPPDCELVCDTLWIPTLSCPSTCLTVCPALCLSPPPPISVVTDFNKHRQLSVHLIAILAVLATAFFLFTCYTVYKLCTYRRNRSLRRMPSQRRHPDEEVDGGDSDDFFDLDRMAAVVDHPIWYIRTVGLQPSVINAITIVKYKKADGLVEGTDCAVCLSEFEEDETLRLLPKCNHAFHIPCIDTWLGSHTNCPLCRAGIVTSAAGPSPPQEPVSRDSGRVEEARLESVRVGSGSEDEESESGGEMNEDEERGSDIELQPVRRSISMDSVSASIISAAINSGLSQQCERNWESGGKETKVEDGGERVRVVGVQTGSSSIKRSTSCGSKVFLARHSSRS